MELIFVSFFAGVLTVLAPCILPLLPVIVGGASIGGNVSPGIRRPLIIVTSLAVSVLVFSLLLKATTALLGVPQYVWSGISGGIVLLFGLSLLFPEAWERLAFRSGLYGGSNALLQRASGAKRGVVKDILLGASLGPVFSSCSPTYALIIAVVLPQSFAAGVANLAAYAAGLAVVLLLVALAGQAVVRRLGWAANPHGWFRRTVGVLFIVVGIAVLSGLDRHIQTFILDQGWYDAVDQLEKSLR